MKFVKVLASLALATTVGSAVALENIPQLASPPTTATSGEPPGPAIAARGSILDPDNSPTNPDYGFSIATSPKPAGWALLLGALLSGAFIVRRRLAAE